MIAAVIPASDLTADEIVHSVAGLPSDWRVVISANGLGADSLDAAQRLERDGRITLEVCEYVLGKVEAVRRGLIIALDDTAPEIVVQLDGDLKQSPEQATGLVDALAAGKATLMVANRYVSQDLGEQPHRRALSSAMSGLIAALTGVTVRDTVCGLRAYSATLARLFAVELRSFGYGLEVEQLVLAGRAGGLVEEFGVQSNRQADATGAEKLEDNFRALQMWGANSGASRQQQELLCHYVVMLKRRCSFVIDSEWGPTPSVALEYVGTWAGVDDSYTAVLR